MKENLLAALALLIGLATAGAIYYGLYWLFCKAWSYLTTAAVAAARHDWTWPEVVLVLGLLALVVWNNREPANS